MEPIDQENPIKMSSLRVVVECSGDENLNCRSLDLKKRRYLIMMMKPLQILLAMFSST